MADSPSQRYVALPGSDRTLIPGSQVVGPSDPSEVITVTIRLRSRAYQADLDAEVAALGATPPTERTYLTPEQYTAQYGEKMYRKLITTTICEISGTSPLQPETKA